MIRIVDEMLARFDLTPYRRKSPHYLSGGEKQKLAIAAVLAMRPRYIVFDEPTSLLDPQSRQEILSIVQSLHEDPDHPIATIFITQFAREALPADRLLIFHRGEILFDDAPLRVFDHTEELLAIGLEPPIRLLFEKLAKKQKKA